MKRVVLVSPAINDSTPKKDVTDYDAVMSAYAKWMTELKAPGVTMIDLQAAMRKARSDPFAMDKVHYGDDGHLLVARTVLTAVGMMASEGKLATIKADPPGVARHRRSRRGKGARVDRPPAAEDVMTHLP